MSTDPRVSVLMPAYNTEKYIAEAIESILNQTFQDFEFIIIDDGSTDGTWGIIQEYAAKDQRIRAVRHGENKGISVTRNDLVESANAPYIAWQDSDDISLSYRLQLQWEYMETHLEVGIAGGYLAFFSEKGERGVRRYATEDGDLRKKIFRYSPVAQPAAIIRKSAFEGLPMYDIRWPGAEDLHMSFKIGRKWKFGNVPHVLIRYRIQDQSTTFQKLKQLELMTFYVRKRYMFTGFYSVNLVDVAYNTLQFFSLFLMPVKFRIFFFDLLRNQRSTKYE